MHRCTTWHDETADTSVNDVVADLARLADPMSVPRTGSEAFALTLDASESWMMNVVQLGMCVQAILDMSPLDADETLRLLARLVGRRAVTFGEARA